MREPEHCPTGKASSSTHWKCLSTHQQIYTLIHFFSLPCPLVGLNDQIRELREVIELPLTNPELFTRVGIKPPKGTCRHIPLKEKDMPRYEYVYDINTRREC
jgi:hypothetical protein